MSDDRKMIADHVRGGADFLASHFTPYALHIAVAGSIRRHRDFPHDVDLVCIPMARLQQPSLLDGGEGERINMLDEYIVGMAQRGEAELKKGGLRMRGLIFEGVKVDVFYADIDNFGYLLALRTGPGEYSRRLVTSRSFGGLKPQEITLENGYVYRYGKLVSVPSEREFFSAMGVDYILPEYRGL